ncbi:MAG: glycine cleavage T C-terminal barrel domain-containing protein, partial [Pseudomonadota bacterium]
APAQPGEGVFTNGASIGSITSAAWGYRVGKNIAMAYLDPKYSDPSTEVDVLLIGEIIRATVCPLCLFDTENALPRGAAGARDRSFSTPQKNRRPRCAGGLTAKR